jgi:cell division protein FtsI (penicillin-binding protein 3)
MKNLDPKRAKWIRVRMGMLASVMAVALGLLVSTAFRIQVEEASTWRQTAEGQRQKRLHVEPKRGGIVDRNGTPLAISVEVPSVSVDVVELLRTVEGPDEQAAHLRTAANSIGSALHLDPTELYNKLASRKRFLWLKRRVSKEEVEALRDLMDPKKQAKPLRGVSIDGEGHRYYPGREVLGSVLGFVAPDGLGKDGLELALDEDLRGRVEEIKGLRDRAGKLIFADGDSMTTALAGNDVTLAIDQGIQHLVERELSVAQQTYETKGASLVVMDPRTGEILALASTPNYNPNDYSESVSDARRDRAISDRFEPGSVMKVFTMASALAAGAVKPLEQVYCEHGSFKLANVTIHDTHQNDWLTPTQILAKSSNIGTLKIALKLGEPALYSGYRKFGFGEPTGVTLPGEASGVLRPKARPWFEVETANASFGQGVSVTTLQLAMAMGAIADGGRLHEPILVSRITDAGGNVVRSFAPKVRREVVPKHVADLVTEMLTSVVESGGTGVEAAVPGFRVAGKTATAQKADPATGKYSEDKYTASFVGFVPAEKPRLVIAVVLDEPMIGRYGGDLAGPVFRRVAEAGLRYLGITPSQGVAKNTKGSTEPDRAQIAAQVLKPSPAVLDAMNEDSNKPTAPTMIGPPTETGIRVPNIMGLPARDAIRLLMSAGLVPEVEGKGTLVRSYPAVGAPVQKGSSVRIVLESGS